MKCPYCNTEGNIAITEEYKKPYNRNLIILFLVIAIVILIATLQFTGAIISIVLIIITRLITFILGIFRGNKTRTKASCLNCNKQWYI
jgi:uncharacterized membrane protein required for colicin V production